MAQIKKYDILWPDGSDELSIELTCFRLLQMQGSVFDKAAKPNAWARDQEWFVRLMNYNKTTPYHHFRKFSKVLFPDFVWHPAAVDMLAECCEQTLVGLAGNASIGKSQFGAVWSLGNYMAAPLHTQVLTTSTNIRDAKKRIWGAVVQHWNGKIMLGKIINHPTPAIVYVDKDGKVLEARGVSLIPSDQQKNNKEGASKMQGMKSPRMFIFADELSELSESLLGTVLSNVAANDFFHMVGAANPNTYYDPFGVFVEPVEGWTSININTGKWKTKMGGTCLHFDALKSANWLLGENKWPVIKVEKIQQAMDRLGEDSPEFWRMYRGFWCPTGSAKLIYTGQDLEKFKATEKPVWEGTRERFACLDPSFTRNGDRTIFILGSYGKTIDGKMTISFDGYWSIKEDATSADSRDFQIAKKVIDLCKASNIPPRNFAMDATGSGLTFSRIMDQLWSPQIMKVQFGGGASEKVIASRDGKKAKEIFANRVTEIWFSALDYLRNGQFKGFNKELCMELTQRNYEHKQGSGGKLVVESKEDMKSRGTPSPDIADCFMVGVMLCRDRLGVSAGSDYAIHNGDPHYMKRIIKKYNSLYDPALSYSSA